MCFVLEAAERSTVNHPVAVALEFRAPGGRILRVDPAAAFGTFLRVRSQELEFPGLKL